MVLLNEQDHAEHRTAEQFCHGGGAGFSLREQIACDEPASRMRGVLPYQATSRFQVSDFDDDLIRDCDHAAGGRLSYGYTQSDFDIFVPGAESNRTADGGSSDKFNQAMHLGRDVGPREPRFPLQGNIGQRCNEAPGAAISEAFGARRRADKIKELQRDGGHPTHYTSLQVGRTLASGQQGSDYNSGILSTSQQELIRANCQFYSPVHHSPSAASFNCKVVQQDHKEESPNILGKAPSPSPRQDAVLPQSGRRSHEQGRFSPIVQVGL